MTDQKPEQRIEIGAIASAHGIRGQFKVKAFLDQPMDIAGFGPVYRDDGQVLTLKAHSHAKAFVICSAKEVTDRTQAESLRGSVLYVARDQLPDLAPDEIYHADVIGFTLVAQPDQPVGEIVGIHDFGAGTVIEVRIGKKKTIFVPFGDRYEPVIDEASQHLTMQVDPAWLEEEAPPDRQVPK